MYKNIHSNILAKTQEIDGVHVAGVSVLMHCTIVGIVCAELVKHLPVHLVEKYNLKNAPRYCALHDIGKASPGFQTMLGVNYAKMSMDSLYATYIARHEIVSADWLKYNHDLPDAIIAMIRWHHGSKRENGVTAVQQGHEWNEDGHSAYGENEWDDIRNDIYSTLESIFPNDSDFCDTWSSRGITSYGNEIEAVRDANVKYLMGLLCTCDWIGSDEDIFKPSEFMSDVIDIEHIRENAKKAITLYGLDNISVETSLTFGDIWNNYKPNDIQSKLAKIIEPRGVYVVEAPMGSGKTEAAEYAAYTAMQLGYVRGVYFALPTQTTSNSLFGRFSQFVNTICKYPDENIRLMHSKSIFYNNSNSGMRSWFTGKRAILSQFGVGTIDQALAAVLGHIKHFFIRSFGLSNKCVIIDEVHSYDAYTKTLGIELINQLVELDCIVIILSATLTAEARHSIIGCGVDIVNKYPLITMKTENDTSYIGFNSKAIEKNIKISMKEVDNGVRDQSQTNRFYRSRKSTIDDCVARVKSGQMVLWIENTVSEAMCVFQQFAHQVDTGLLHSRFSNKDREVNETKWINRYGKEGVREHGCILVSTQVCEQSIDIDADYLVTALCPTDMLLQRIGRLFRHERTSRKYNAECLILTHRNYHNFTPVTGAGDILMQFRNATGPANFVYHPYIMRKTQRVFQNKNNITIPNDIRLLLEETYKEEELNEVDIEFKRWFDNNGLAYVKEAKNSLLNSFGRSSEEVALNNMPKSRLIQQDTVEVILCNSIKGNSIETIGGVTINLNSKHHLDELRAINNDSVKINKNVIAKNQNTFIEVEIEKRRYTLAVVRDGFLVDNGGSLTTMNYSSTIGFQK